MSEIWYVDEGEGFNLVSHVFETQIEAERYARMLFPNENVVLRHARIYCKPVVSFRAYGMGEIAILKKYAMDNYEDGGHWVVETYSNADYAEVLGRCSSLEEAKQALKENWELCVMQEKECGWG